jgi:sarcosine oxidase
MATFDVIVLGLGAMGSAALYQLARRGAAVLGIDRFAPPHPYGSSGGETRITRIACGEGSEYSGFAQRSHAIWREIEGETGAELLTQNGLLVISGKGPRAAGHDNPEFLKTTIEAAQLAQVPHRVMTGAEVRTKFPAFNVRHDDVAYHDEVGGFVRPERCIAAQLSLGRRGGAAIQMNETALGFESSAGGVRITTDKSSYMARRLIITAGPWLPELLGDTLSSPFTAMRQVLYWFAPRDEKAQADFNPERCPVFIWQIPAPQIVYGFPALGGVEDGVKIATEQYDEATFPDAVKRTVDVDEIAAMHRTYVAPYFRGLTGTCLKTHVCLYTWVPKARFIIDRHPQSENVIVASPCSGHGFKHSAAIGELLAQMALGEPHADIRRFSFAAGSA